MRKMLVEQMEKKILAMEKNQKKGICVVEPYVLKY